jgi:hypothetical protein
MSTQIATHVSHIVFALRWLLLVGLGWMFKKGGSSGGGGGGGVTWANDLAGSSNTHQWLASISGSGGAGGAVPVANATYLQFAKTGDTASTSARINFQGQAAETYIGYRDAANTHDRIIVSCDGSNDLQFGDFNGGNTVVYGNVQITIGNTSVNALVANGTAVTIGASAASISMLAALSEFIGSPTTFDASSPVTTSAYVQFVPATSPASPTHSVLIGKTASSGVGDNVVHHSHANMDTVLAPAGQSARQFIDRQATQLLAIPGVGGTATADYAWGGGNTYVADIDVVVIGVSSGAAAGLRLTSRAAGRSATGVTALLAPVGGDANPKNDPYGNDCADATFGASSIAVTATGVGGTFRVTVTNQAAVAQDFTVFFEVKGFT